MPANLHSNAKNWLALDIPLSLILVGSLLWRILLAHIFPLATDEAYGMVAGRSFSLSFYDHPPVSFWFAAAAERVLGGDAELSLRLPTLILGTLSVFGFYLVGAHLGGKQVGRVCAVLAGLTPYIGFAGVTTVPDSTLIFGLIFSLYALLRLASGEEEKAWLWALGSLGLALALASKYQALFFPLGVLIWLISSPTHRHWFTLPRFWLCVFIACTGTLPLIFWNLQHEWVSFAFHASRTEAEVNLPGFLALFSGQFAYFGGLLLALAVWQFGREKNWRAPEHRLILISGGLIFVFFNAVFFVASSGLPHWPLPGAILLLPLIALHWAELGRVVRSVTLTLLALSQMGVLLIGLHVSFGILSLGQSPSPDWDRTMPLTRLAPVRDAWAATDTLAPPILIYTRNWQEAGHLGAVFGPDVPIQVLGNEANHFAFLPQLSADVPTYLMGLSLLSETDAFQEDLVTLARRRGFDPNPIHTLMIPRGGSDYQALIILSLE